MHNCFEVFPILRSYCQEAPPCGCPLLDRDCQEGVSFSFAEVETPFPTFSFFDNRGYPG